VDARRSDKQAQVFSITGAASSLTDDQSGRTRRYLWSMGLRTACFIGAVVATGWLRWALVAGAVVLPYVAVVVANGGREGRKRPPTVTLPSTAPAIESTTPVIIEGRAHRAE